ncbi:ligand-binding sensor domain-containing protein [Dyadobacter fermentans]|uniref:Signal transduction histidine kinase, LytS n=1 Tax=Dyadobacter fermentans (strain ATCC 700827 / DSM 18053 / CIP 107007 / KCTC 52180 / NS114) TaxID=471854 RepID=C6VZU4_DYAFD|nr:histidine kinase [Dyadobacter fermentans]ACT93572.1 signal transduction histidine kinase, LytS [Dyadobacter fermentans DSM 18053]
MKPGRCWKSLLLCIQLLAGWVHAQDRVFEVNQYDERQGLSSRLVHCMIQDKKGFLWLGTSDGLNRYDGHGFITFRSSADNPKSMAGNYITALAEDLNGNIWVGFYTGGISCYNPVRGQFTNYEMTDVQGRDLSGEEVKMLYIDRQNTVWTSIKGEGLIRLDQAGGKHRQYNIVETATGINQPEYRKAFNIVYRVYEQPGGRFYLLTHTGLYLFNKTSGNLNAIPDPDASGHLVPQNLFISYTVEDDVLWLGSWAGGLAAFNIKTGGWKRYRFDPRILPTTNIISGIHHSGSDTLWLTSIDRGFGYFDKKKEEFVFLAGKQGFPTGSYNGLLADRENNLWLNTENMLVAAFRQSKPFTFVPVNVKKRDHSVFHSITSIIEDDHFKLTATLWADGLQVHNKKTGVTKALGVDTHMDEPLQRVNNIWKDKSGTVWVISRDVIYTFDPVRETLVKIPQPPAWTAEKPSNFFLSIRQDKANTFWIATARNGLFRYDPRNAKYTHYAPSATRPIATRLISAIDTDEYGTLWVAGKNGYLAFYDQKQDAFLPVPVAYKDRKAKSVSSVFCQPGGRLYVGTELGLLLYDISKSEKRPVSLYTGSDGLKGDIVSSMQSDRSGKVWCITQTALCRIDPLTHRISSYGLSDGITKPDIGYGISHLPGGFLAVTANNGYYQFHPFTLLGQKAAKVPVITSFKVYGQEYYYQKELSRNGFVRLEPDENSFSFEFSVLDYKTPDAYQYFYKLEDIDADWVRAGSRRYVGYTNIPGGRYNFRVKAAIHPDDLTQAELTIPFYVETAFYNTWWFRIAVMIFLAGLGFLYYQNQIRSKSRIYGLQSRAATLEKEKAMIMYESLKQQLNPHFLFNSLTSLGSLIWIDQKLATRFLESLGKMYRYILQNRDTELVPLEDEIRFVQMYIDLQQTRFEQSLLVTFDVDQQLLNLKIVPVTLQNLIENAIKHNIITIEDPLKICIYTQQTWLVVENNLQKKNFVQTSNRQGLASLVSLYRYLSQRPVEIEETPNAFKVKIPLI